MLYVKPAHVYNRVDILSLIVLFPIFLLHIRKRMGTEQAYYLFYPSTLFNHRFISSCRIHSRITLRISLELWTASAAANVNYGGNFKCMALVLP